MSPKEKERVLEPGLDGENAASQLNDEREPAKPKKKPIALFILLFVVVVGGFFGIKAWLYGRGHVSTDDAYVTSDVIQIAPQVTATLTSTPVSGNQHVNKGDLIAVFDDSSYRAAVNQAKANLALATAQANGATSTVDLTQQTGAAQIQQAQGVVAQNQAGVAGSYADLTKAGAAIGTAQAGLQGAQANVGSLRAAYQSALANVARAKAAIGAAQAQEASAQASARAASSAVDAAQAAATRETKNLARIQTLYREGAISQQAAEQEQSAADTANANLQSARDQVSAANALAQQQVQEVASARQQLVAAQASADQAKKQIDAGRAQVGAAQASVSQAEAARQSASQAIAQAQAKVQQATGQLSQAKTVTGQVAVSQSARAQALAKVEQAKAALQQAEIDLSRTRIYAPVSGHVQNSVGNVGQLVVAGTPIMAIIPDETMWVEANFKETQLASMRVGQKAEVEVDALDATLTGHLDSIASGTGSTFALLPAENATGNFTKVVQRVPVKVVFDPGQADMDRLRSGMSVTATIEVK
jgi:membrane fusion protein (multidrug efflux system)